MRSVTIIGAGIGGLAAAAALRQRGIAVDVYEQADKFARVGAGIQQSPNAVRVHRGLGIEDRAAAGRVSPGVFAQPRRHLRQRSPTIIRSGARSSERYGAPYLTLHRGDLHEALASIVPGDACTSARSSPPSPRAAPRVELSFADGSEVEADAVIGADGVHSLIRDMSPGPSSRASSGGSPIAPPFPRRAAARGRDRTPRAPSGGDRTATS